ncbi:hypothetical protein BB561_004241 [Smittium simulii]|uniref:Pentacotripeptide-repeat region of PRORP domain-containing protein n=1 Tax=Smittium simulii TaxID=133385 RepID=A0A2T9YHB0_9FUNG|nr:hypothetical protein BB561_004241 [Smittium simulii]
MLSLIKTKHNALFKGITYNTIKFTSKFSNIPSYYSKRNFLFVISFSSQTSSFSSLVTSKNIKNISLSSIEDIASKTLPITDNIADPENEDNIFLKKKLPFIAYPTASTDPNHCDVGAIVKQFITQVKNEEFSDITEACLCLNRLPSYVQKEIPLYIYNTILHKIRVYQNSLNRLDFNTKLKIMNFIHDIMINNSINPDVFTYNEIISIHLFLLNITQVRDIVNKMKTFGPYPDTAIYNNIITSYSKSVSTISNAYEYWDELIKISESNQALQPDVYSFVAIISTEIKNNNLSKVKEFLSLVEKYNIPPSIHIRNEILSGIATNHGLEPALLEADLIIEQGLELNSKSHIIIIKAALLANSMDVVKEYIAKHVENKFEIDKYFLSIFQMEQKLLLELLENCGATITIDMVAFLVHKSLKNDQKADTSYLFNYIKFKKLVPTNKIYGIWFNELSKKGNMDTIKLLYRDMLAQYLVPDIYIFSSIFSALYRAKIPKSQLKAGIEHWENIIRQQKLQPTYYFNITKFDCYFKTNNSLYFIKKTLEGMYEMLTKGILDPRINAFDFLFRALKYFIRDSINNNEFYSKLFRFIVRLNKDVLAVNYKYSLNIENYINEIKRISSDHYHAKINEKTNDILKLEVEAISIEILKWVFIMKNNFNVVPEPRTYSYILECLVGLKKDKHALMIFKQIIEASSTNAMTLHNIFSENENLFFDLVKLQFENRNLDNVLYIWRAMKQHHTLVKSYLIIAMLKSCDMRGHIETAIDNMDSIIKVDASTDISYPEDMLVLLQKNKMKYSLLSMQNGNVQDEINSEVMYLYITILIKSKRFENILPTLEIWRKNNSKLTKGLLPQSQNNTRYDFEDDMGDIDDDNYNDSSYSKSRFLSSDMIKNIFTSLQNPQLEAETNGKSVKCYIELAIYAEKHYPWVISI